MILYEGTTEHFNEDVMQNSIADRAAEKYRTYYKRSPGNSEYRSWAISLAILNNSFIYSGLKDNHIVVEYELPYGAQRVGVVAFGHYSLEKEKFVILGRKQWSNEKVLESEVDGNVIV